MNGPNALINETLVHSYDQSSVNRIKPSIIQGFKWSTREGPLCD
jgi:U5 small nuclear ribonucleoprotein component